MHIPRPPHNWRVSPQQAILIQRRMASQVLRCSSRQDYRFICGVDATFSLNGKDCLAAVVLWDLVKRQAAEERTSQSRLHFPYVPGLLSFREAPAIIGALRKLQHRPDILLCDGQGIAHQRRLGIASHLGLLTGLPSIGCGKTRLLGSHDPVGPLRGDHTDLMDKDECVGSVLRTKDGVKPLFISIGHKIDLDQAEKTILDCCSRYRLPEPIRLAHQLASISRKST